MSGPISATPTSQECCVSSLTDPPSSTLLSVLCLCRSNVFLARPRLSPSKSSSSRPPASTNDSTHAISQAMGGMNVADRDWIGESSVDLRKKPSAATVSVPPARPASLPPFPPLELTLSPPIPSCTQTDRFIPQRSFSSTSSSVVAPALHASNNPNDSFSAASLASSVNSSPSSSSGAPQQTRILAFAQAPPAASASHDLAHAQLRRYTKAAPTSSGAGGGGPGGKLDPKARKRAIPTRPDRVLDAPGMVDDYYLNLLSWSSDNMVAIGLGESVYVWNAESGGVSALGE